MITPIELHNKQHKTGRGYNKKEMDLFLDEVLNNYETLYKENAELKEKINQLSDGVQYYKAMETTLQKALVLAEKTSKDTIESANAKAEVIEKEAHLKADTIVNNAISKSEEIKKECISLLQQYNQFKAQFKQIAQKQIELLDGNFYEIYSKDLIDAINEVANNQEDANNQVETNVTEKIDEPEITINPGEIIEATKQVEVDEVATPEINATEDDDVAKGDTKEFAPIEIEIIGKNLENNLENNAPVAKEEVNENIKIDFGDELFHQKIRELKEDLAIKDANESNTSLFEFIDNE